MRTDTKTRHKEAQVVVHGHLQTAWPGKFPPKCALCVGGQVGTRMGVDGYRGIWMGAVQLGGMYEHGKGAQRDRNRRGVT